MASPLSVDRRERGVSAVMASASCRQAGERFGVSAAGVSRRHARHLRNDHVRPKPMGGDQRSHVIKAQALRILRLCDERGDIARAKLRDALAEQGVTASPGSLSRFLARHSQKGALHAARDPDRLVFIDGTAASTRMARRDRWAPRGQRCRLIGRCSRHPAHTFVCRGNPFVPAVSDLLVRAGFPARTIRTERFGG